MKVAYLILTHKNPKQLKRLINCLDGDVYIHLDKKVDIEDFKEIDRNLFINQRNDIKWGGFSMINATLNLIVEANSQKKYDFFMLLSGDDYPIKSNQAYLEFLSQNKEYDFIEVQSFKDFWPHQTYRYKIYRLFESYNFFTKVIQWPINRLFTNRKEYGNWDFYKGSQWWCLTGESIKYIIDYLDNNKKCITYFSHTTIPDEMFFQTILMNSERKKYIRNDNLRYIRLGNNKHPDLLGLKDVEILKSVKNKFFARKFDSNMDDKVLDEIDRLLVD